MSEEAVELPELEPDGARLLWLPGALAVMGAVYWRGGEDGAA